MSLPFGFFSATWLGSLLLSVSPHSAFRKKKKVALLLVTDLSGLEGKKQVPGFMAIALYHLFKGNPYQRK